MRLPVVLVLCACQPDPTDDDPLRTDTADPAPLDPILHVVSPGDGWVDVAPLTDVVFTFDVTLDAEVEPTVELADDRGRAVRTTARVAGDELRIEPAVALAWGRSHTVRVDGLAAEDGRLIDTVTSSFTVHPFPPVTRSLGERSLSISVYDDAGNTIRFVLYDDPGPDGEFGTPDDVQSYRNEIGRAHV